MSINQKTKQLIHHSEEAQYVVEVGYEHEGEEDAHADELRAYHEFVAWLTTENHLVKQEHDVSAIEGGDGQDVHKGEDDGEERCHHPEHLPVPYGWEHGADGTEAAELFRAFGGEDVFEVADISAEHIEGVAYACWDAGEEVVFLVRGCGVSRYRCHADAEVYLVVEDDAGGVNLARCLLLIYYGGGEDFQGVLTCGAVAEDVCHASCLVGEGVP